jgi:prolyl-tRNA editing enzyme YbaK/EbsC (Cys-tRNA(Pro) deacylase)
MECMFQRNLKGVVGEKLASLKLKKCTAASTEDINVEALCGAVVELTGCTVSDCLEGKGLDAKDKGTHVVAKETQFEGNIKGVVVVGLASVQLDKCTAASLSNKECNVEASSSAVVSLTGCTVADCLKRNGLKALFTGTRVKANETMFQGNSKGVVVEQGASVQLIKCTAANNKDTNVKASRGAAVELVGYTVADCLGGQVLYAEDKGTSVQLCKCTAESNKYKKLIASSGAVVSTTGCTVGACW